MIPVSLSLQGIYSYQQKVDIDFRKLLDGQLFGIFGPVGSGKSTILEAISFALYGETERLNKNDKRSYNMMNLRSGELFIDFVFKAGKEENYYRFMVRGKRNKRQFEKTGQFERQGYKWQNDDWHPLDTNDASSIIGLSYENFRRTIIIPQGKFQEFLELGDKDRTRMLKEIFQLDRFDLYDKAAHIERNAENQENHLKGQYAKYEHITQEQIPEKEQQLASYSEKINKTGEKLNQKQQFLAELQQLREIFQKINQQKEIIRNLKDREQEINDKEKSLLTYENCYRLFQYDLTQLDEVETTLEKEKTTYNQNLEKYEELQNQINQNEQQFEELKKEFNNKNNLEKQIEDLQKLIKINSLNDEIQTHQKRVATGEQFYEDTTKKVKDIKSRYNQLANEIKSLKQKMPDTNQLATIKEWFSKKNHLLTDKEKQHKQIQDIQNTLNDLEAQKKQYLRALFGENEAQKWQKASIADIQTHIQSEKDKLEASIREKEDQIKHLEVQETLESYARDLENGKPCPVCGSTEHPEPVTKENVDQSLKEANHALANLKTSLNTYTDAGQRMKELDYRQKDKQSSLDKYQNDYNTIVEQLKANYEQFQWEDFDPENESEIKETWEHANQLKSDLESKERELESLYQNQEKEQNQQEEAMKKLQLLRREITEKETTRKNLIEGLKILHYEDFRETQKAELEKQVKNLETRVADIDKKYHELEAWLTENRKSRDTLHGQLATQQQNIEGYQNKVTKIRESLDQKITENNYKDLEEIKNILAHPMDIEKTREEINQFKKDLHSAQSYLKKLEEDTRGKTFDEKQYEQFNREVNELSEQLEQLKAEKTNAETALKQLKGDLEVKKDLEKQLEKVADRKEKINLIKRLFQGSGFVNYISSVYLQNLCNAANDRFYKLTRQKMRLELTENNNFQIRDFLNDGQVRSIKTLSGGQLFQASLSLALALAESIQQQNQLKQNFFFLDEGFGSQDKHSLQLVFETLKSLRKENRIVGIISHVEELQEEIDVHLQVENDEEEGSKVKASWEVG